jgi:hypothetical protein
MPESCVLERHGEGLGYNAYYSARVRRIDLFPMIAAPPPGTEDCGFPVGPRHSRKSQLRPCVPFAFNM